MKCPPGVTVQANHKGWMDEEGVQLWQDQAWNIRLGSLLRQHSMLVWDMFQAHLTEASKEKACELRTSLDVIPGGLTSVLQLRDICLNKLFKEHLREKWTEWMSSDLVKMTKGGLLVNG